MADQFQGAPGAGGAPPFQPPFTPGPRPPVPDPVGGYKGPSPELPTGPGFSNASGPGQQAPPIRPPSSPPIYQGPPGTGQGGVAGGILSRRYPGGAPNAGSGADPFGNRGPDDFKGGLPPTPGPTYNPNNPPGSWGPAPPPRPAPTIGPAPGGGPAPQFHPPTIGPAPQPSPYGAPPGPSVGPGMRSQATPSVANGLQAVKPAGVQMGEEQMRKRSLGNSNYGIKQSMAGKM